MMPWALSQGWISALRGLKQLPWDSLPTDSDRQPHPSLTFRVLFLLRRPPRIVVRRGQERLCGNGLTAAVGGPSLVRGAEAATDPLGRRRRRMSIRALSLHL